MKKLDMAKVTQGLQQIYEGTDGPAKVMAMLRRQQTAVYVACGGGMLGHSAAEEPFKFYIDDRVGRLPYCRTAIYQMVEVLKIMVRVCRLRDYEVPVFISPHSSGVF